MQAQVGRLGGWEIWRRRVDEIQSCFPPKLDADWVLSPDQSPHSPACLVWVASCWNSDGLVCLFVFCMSCVCVCVLLGCAVTEVEVRRCPCWVCTSQSRVGGENSSLHASGQAGRQAENEQGQAWMKLAGEAGTQGRGAAITQYQGTPVRSSPALGNYRALSLVRLVSPAWRPANAFLAHLCCLDFPVWFGAVRLPIAEVPNHARGLGLLPRGTYNNNVQF